MPDQTGETPPPPGWYPDGAGSPGLRWWDGRAWTEQRSAPAGAAAIVQPPLPPGTTPSTVWIWLLSLLPVLSFLGEQPLLLSFGPLIQEQLRMQREILANPGTTPTLPVGFGQLGGAIAVGWGTSFVLIGLAALGAWLDHRALKRKGVVRPFPWGWGFLTGVYIVGRAVVVHRRVGSGYAPMVLAIVLFAALTIAQLVEFSLLFASMGALAG